MKTLCLLFFYLAMNSLIQAQPGLTQDSLKANKLQRYDHVEMDAPAIATIKLFKFNTVKVSSYIHVVLIPVPVSDTCYLYVRNEGDIKYSVVNNILNIKAKNAMLNSKVITVLVGVKNLNKLILNGNSSINTTGILPCAKLEISCSDNSTCLINTHADIIKTTQTPNCQITIVGNYTIHQSSVNGFGDINIEYDKQ